MGKQQKKPRVDVGSEAAPLSLSLGSLLGREEMPPRAPEETSREEKSTRPPRELPGRVILSRETKGRGGKTVTRISFREGAPSDPAALAKKLRNALGCGGTVEGEAILLQGDQTERAGEWFASLNVKVTRAN
jgi:translation initiation factor 1